MRTRPLLYAIATALSLGATTGCTTVYVPDHTAQIDRIGQQTSENTSALARLDQRVIGAQRNVDSLASRVDAAERNFAIIKDSPHRYWTLEKGKSYNDRNYDVEFGSVLQLAIAKNLDPILAEKMRNANVLLIGELLGDPENYAVIAGYDVNGDGLKPDKVTLRDQLGRTVEAQDVIFNGLDHVGDIHGFKVPKSAMPPEINMAIAEARFVRFNPKEIK